MLDIEQTQDGLKISYFNSEGDIDILDVPIPKSEFYNWAYCEPNDKDREPNWISWDNKPVKKVKGRYLKKFRVIDLLDRLSPETQELIYSPNTPKKYFCDIEVDVGDDGFPSPKNASQPINTFGFCNEKNNVFVLGRKLLTPEQIEEINQRINEYLAPASGNRKWTFKYQGFNSEYDMMYTVGTKLIPKMPVLTGWNFVGYDWEYMVNRCKRLDLNLPQMSSPTGKSHGRENYPHHRLIVDYLEIYRFWDRTVAVKESNKLDWVATEVLGVPKLHYPGSLKDLYHKDYLLYVLYNAIDCCLVRLLDEKLNTFSTYLSLAKAGKVAQYKAFSSVYIMERQMYPELIKRRKLLIEHEHNNNDDDEVYDGYTGAYVMQPERGLHELVATLDFASMYPSIMRQYNIGSESYLGKLLKPGDTEFLNIRTNKLERLNKNLHICTAFGYDDFDKLDGTGGSVFMKNEDSVLRSIVTRLYNERYNKKHAAQQIEREIEYLKSLIS